MVEIPIEIDRELPAADSWSLDRQPDTAEVYQEEPVGPRVPVELDGPVRVQQAGSVAETYRSVVVNDTDGTKLFNADPRRSYVTIWATDNPFFLANTAAEVQSSGGAGVAKIPINVPITIKATDRVFVRCATNAATSLISMVMGQWAR